LSVLEDAQDMFALIRLTWLHCQAVDDWYKKSLY